MKHELEDATGEMRLVRVQVEALREEVAGLSDDLRALVDRRVRNFRMEIVAIAAVLLVLVGLLWQQQRTVNASVGFLCAQMEARDTGIARLIEEEAEPSPSREQLAEFLRRDPCPRR